MQQRKIRAIIFLRDVLILALSAFGGPQAHFSMLLELMVFKRRYISESELLELHALCQVLPGPTSTQTVVAIGYKIGGARLAYLTLLVWALPASIIMISIGIYMSYLQQQGIPIHFTRFIQPMAVAFISFSALKIIKITIKSKTSIALMLFGASAGYSVAIYFGNSIVAAIVFPVLLIVGGLASSLKFSRLPNIEDQKPTNIEYKNFFLFIGVFAVAALLGNITQWKLVLIFENFYRNGSLIFGGGQVLVPLLKTEFVDYKNFLTNEQFLSGISFVQAVPGPVFSISGYVGAISMKEYGILGQMAGGTAALLGIFLPGTFLIFFVYSMWNELKKYKMIRASLEGINAVSAGLVIAAALLLTQSLKVQLTDHSGIISIGVIVVTFITLYTEKIPSPYIIFLGLILGFVL